MPLKAISSMPASHQRPAEQNEDLAAAESVGEEATTDRARGHREHADAAEGRDDAGDLGDLDAEAAGEEERGEGRVEREAEVEEEPAEPVPWRSPGTSRGL